MNKANEPWYWDNVNAAIALTLIVAMIALCCWLAPDRKGKVTMYQNDNLTIQCIEKKAGACERVKIKDEGVKNENNSRDFGPQDSMSWNTSSLAWVFAANSKAALDDPERRVHGYLRDVIRVQGIERPYIVRPRGKSGRSATAFAWVREAEL